MMEPPALLAVALGAAIGGVARYLISLLFVMRFGPAFPWGTLFINVSGSLLIGIVAALAEAGAVGMTPLMRLFAATGVLGGYTTFSAFSLEAVTLSGEGGGLFSLLYMFGSVALGFSAAYAGMICMRLALR